MKVYVKTNRRGDYHNLNFANAAYGYLEMGFEVIKYLELSDIIDKVTEEDIVVDYINQCEAIFHKFNKQVELCDYPEVLQKYLGRKIWKDTINHINCNPELWNCFVKPVKHKAFTGKVIREPKDLIGCGSSTENFEVICGDIVEFKREWRIFIWYDKIINIKPYMGDYHYVYSPETIDSIIRDFKTWEERPMGCSIDIGVISDNKTLLIEVNDGFALGTYGLGDIDYAKLMSARWAQIMERKDECLF